MRRNWFKRGICVILQAALIVVACMPVSLAASAATPNTASKLFHDGYYDSEQEKYDRLLHAESNQDDNGKFKKTEFIISRKAGASITVTGNNVVHDGLRITIPKGYTLTINKGASLKIFGELVIEGSLVNNGTITIGSSDHGAFSEGVVKASLSNKASVSNAGVIKILFGTLDNRTGAKMENTGTITIAVAEPNMTGMQNRSTTKNGVTTYGTVVNKGVINVENTTGTGLHNFANASFTNEGKIYKTKRGTIKGIISGAAVLSK